MLDQNRYVVARARFEQLLLDSGFASFSAFDRRCGFEIGYTRGLLRPNLDLSTAEYGRVRTMLEVLGCDIFQFQPALVNSKPIGSSDSGRVHYPYEASFFDIFSRCLKKAEQWIIFTNCAIGNWMHDDMWHWHTWQCVGMRSLSREQIENHIKVRGPIRKKELKLMHKYKFQQIQLMRRTYFEDAYAENRDWQDAVNGNLHAMGGDKLSLALADAAAWAEFNRRLDALGLAGVAEIAVLDNAPIAVVNHQCGGKHYLERSPAKVAEIRKILQGAVREVGVVSRTDVCDTKSAPFAQNPNTPPTRPRKAR